MYNLIFCGHNECTYQQQLPPPLSCSLSWFLLPCPIWILLFLSSSCGSLPNSPCVDYVLFWNWLPPMALVLFVSIPCAWKSLIISVPICSNTWFIFKPVFALVSKKLNPCCSASAYPRAASIFFSLSGISVLFAINTLRTFGNAC